MEAKEMRELSAEEIASKVKDWQQELFRARFIAPTGEKRDISISRKLRQHISRALTITNEKRLASQREVGK